MLRLKQELFPAAACYRKPFRSHVSAPYEEITFRLIILFWMIMVFLILFVNN